MESGLYVLYQMLANHLCDADTIECLYRAILDTEEERPKTPIIPKLRIAVVSHPKCPLSVQLHVASVVHDTPTLNAVLARPSPLVLEELKRNNWAALAILKKEQLHAKIQFSPEELRQLAKKHGSKPTVLEAIVADINCPADVQIECIALAEKSWGNKAFGRLAQQAAIATNHQSVRDHIIDFCGARLCARLSENTTLTPTEMERLAARDINLAVLQALIKRPDCPTSVVERCLRSQNTSVRDRAMHHPNLPDHLKIANRI